MKTYRNGNERVEIEKKKVIYSDTEYCKTGEKPNMDFLKRCGWKLDKAAKISSAYLINNKIRIK